MWEVGVRSSSWLTLGSLTLICFDGMFRTVGTRRPEASLDDRGTGDCGDGRAPRSRGAGPGCSGFASSGAGGALRRAERCVRPPGCPSLGLSFSVTASAAPTVTLKVTAIPIPGVPGTGDTLGAGAEVEAGSRSAGPNTEASLSAHQGHLLRARGGQGESRGIHHCPPATLEAIGAPGCPSNSRAGPTGEGLGVVVSVANASTRECPSSPSCPRGRPDLLCRRQHPGLLPNPRRGALDHCKRPLWAGVARRSAAGRNRARRRRCLDPLLQSQGRCGLYSRGAKKTISYLTLPKSCPRGGFPVKAELQFMSGEIVTVAFKQRCPSHR